MSLFSKVIRVLRTEGLKGLCLRIKIRLGAGHTATASVIEVNKREVGFSNLISLKHIPYSKEDYIASENFKSNKDSISINWIVPEVGVGSGGHINIFRFVSHLQKRGHKNRIYIFGNNPYRNNEDFRKFVFDNFDLDRSVEVYWSEKYIKYADATIATSWPTAYFVKSFDNTQKKFYFVQDFEPLFYAVGSEYAFAENTYKMGFVGLTAGDWLKNKLENDYAMKCTSFSFSYDKQLYKPFGKRDKKSRLLFYARPVTQRRMFELGVLALNEFHFKFPEVEIIMAGWDVSDYHTSFPFQNAGTVSTDELGEMYSDCDLVITLSGTNLSLLPLEVMACNVALMSNRGANVDWLLDDNNSILCDLTIEDIVTKLCAFFSNKDSYKDIVENGYQCAIASDWESECIKVEKAIKSELADVKQSK
ncbi:MAG: glycosyltransferase family 1 protein [Oscillospiraceae bacterium]|nr:glycosyltransferase family 1 protein [Oscillospiraceae bacterium]